MKGRSAVRRQQVVSTGEGHGTALPTGKRLLKYGGLPFTGQFRYVAPRFSNFFKRRKTTGFLCKTSHF